MSKMVGLSRNIKLRWLNETVQLVQEGFSDEEIHDKLTDYLSFEIKSATNIRKTREILMNIWVREGNTSAKLRSDALCLIEKYPEYDLIMHWCMMLSVYPVFGDLCKYIGKMSEFQDEIILAQLKQKIFDEWGERATLFHSIDKIIATLKDFETIECDKPGKYSIRKHSINNQEVAAFMVYTMMLVDEGSYYEYMNLNSASYYFPFEYQIEKEFLYTDERFMISNFDGKLCLALKG